MRDEVCALTTKSKKDLAAIAKLYQSLSKEIEKRFREELREQHNRMDGLEDFYQLSLLVKKNAQFSVNVLGMLSKLSDISGYDISEEIEKEDNLDKIVNDLAGK